jgi:hypothetical protein
VHRKVKGTVPQIRNGAVENLSLSCVIKRWYYRVPLFYSVALQSLKDLGRLTYRRFLELFRHMVGLLGRVISPSQGLHRTTQHRKRRTNIHALSGIQTHDPSSQPAKTHASDRTATVTGHVPLSFYIYFLTQMTVVSEQRYYGAKLKAKIVTLRPLRGLAERGGRIKIISITKSGSTP